MNGSVYLLYRSTIIVLAHINKPSAYFSLDTAQHNTGHMITTVSHLKLGVRGLLWKYSGVRSHFPSSFSTNTILGDPRGFDNNRKCVASWPVTARVHACLAARLGQPAQPLWQEQRTDLIWSHSLTRPVNGCLFCRCRKSLVAKRSLNVHFVCQMSSQLARSSFSYFLVIR